MMTQERKAEIDAATKAGTPLILTEAEIHDYYVATYFPGMTTEQIAAIIQNTPFAGA
jgi:hypothetical protein